MFIVRCHSGIMVLLVREVEIRPCHHTRKTGEDETERAKEEESTLSEEQFSLKLHLELQNHSFVELQSYKFLVFYINYFNNVQFYKR
jgi:hypothetical protein